MGNVWVVKCRFNQATSNNGWHWDKYFDDATDELFTFGGADWIRSHGSRKHIRDNIRQGDVVICYQTDGQTIEGITRMASAGREDPEDSSQFCMFDLPPAKEACRIVPPLKLKDIQQQGCRPKCFVPGNQGTQFPMSKQEYSLFLKAIRALRPGLSLPSWMTGDGRDSGVPTFFVNSDEESGPGGWKQLLKKSLFCTGGRPKFGQMLRPLSKGSRLFLYVNRMGIVAEGVVSEEWSGRENAPPYTSWQKPEYSLKVDWIKRIKKPEQAVSVDKLRGLGQQHFRRTIFPISADIADKLSAELPGNKSGRQSSIFVPRRGGAGFGSPEQNRLVEQAAINFVTTKYKEDGWQVRSVEQENRGYDLLCTRRGLEAHVEVKGISGSTPTFQITANEVKTARKDATFRLCVVTNALSQPRIYCALSGKQFLSQFALNPLQYMAVPIRP